MMHQKLWENCGPIVNMQGVEMEGFKRPQLLPSPSTDIWRGATHENPFGAVFFPFFPHIHRHNYYKIYKQESYY